MSSNALKALAAGLVLVALVLGFLAYKLTPGLQTAAPAPEPQPNQLTDDQVLAVIAVQRIPAYEPIPPEAVVLAPISVEPEQYFSDIQAVVGKVPLRQISMGTPVTNESFTAANTLAQAIPAGMQAMSLSISDVIAVGGFVKPGDIVDVLVYIRSSGREVKDSQARLLLKKARVLAYEERLINATAQDKENEGNQQNQRRERTAVIAIPEKDTTRVMLGASLGELRLALRPPEEAETISDRPQFVSTEFRAETDGQAGQEGSDGTPRPETLAPRSVVAAESDTKAAKDKKDTGAEPITLSELAGLKKKSTGQRNIRRRPPPATIEVYEGAKRSTVTRRN